MTFALQSTGHHHPVGASLERAQHLQHVEFAGAGQLDDLDRGRILKPHRAGQVGGGVGAVMAAEGDDVGFKAILVQGSSLSATEAQSILEN